VTNTAVSLYIGQGTMGHDAKMRTQTIILGREMNWLDKSEKNFSVDFTIKLC